MIKNYEKFLIQEGIIEDAIGTIKKSYDFFKNKFKEMVWLYFGIYAQRKGWFKSEKNVKPKVELFVYNSEDRKALNITDKDDNINESLLYEGKVNLESYDKSVLDYNIPELAAKLKTKYKLRLDDPDDMPASFIWGAPGIGKTDVVKQLAKSLNINLIIWHLSQIEPTDFIGLPEITKIDDRNRTGFALPKIFPLDGPNNKGGIMFLDELNLANNLVLNAGMSLCLDGKVNDYVVPSNWLVIAAGNRKEDVPSVSEMSSALRSRFAHFNLVTSVEDWTAWALNNKKMDHEIIAFINFNRDAFHYLDLDLEQSAWPSPRSWAKASKEYIVEKKDNNGALTKEQIKKIFAQYVGYKWANDFASYLDIIHKFSEEDIKSVYNDPERAKVIRIGGGDNLRLDQACSIMSCIAFYMKQKALTKEQFENVFKYSIRIDNMEIATSLLSALYKVHPEVLKDPIYDFRELNKKYWYAKYKKDITL